MTLIPQGRSVSWSPPSASVTINFGTTQQTIDGFGASDSFLDVTPISDANADLFFDQTLGIGLSILRTGFTSSGATMSFYSNAIKASARGAKIMAYPFTAAAGQKDNGSETNGGHLLAASRDAWATTMAGFQATMVAAGGPPITWLSVQNEPDISASYVSMLYTAAEMTAFIKVLGPKLAALSPVPLLMMPELANWANTWAYTADALGDVTAAPYVGVVNAHQYNGVSAPSGIGSLKVWQSEMSYFDTFDATMTKALVVAQAIHDALTTGNASAWLWWWILRTSQSDNEGLTDTAAPTKRLYVLGNWSKFVRPGYVRVSTTGSVASVSVTAFLNSATGAFVVVAINQNGTTQNFNMGLTGLRSGDLTPWVTSASLNLEAQPAIPIVGYTAFPVSLPANSVTSFVGTGS